MTRARAGLAHAALAEMAVQPSRTGGCFTRQCQRRRLGNSVPSQCPGAKRTKSFPSRTPAPPIPADAASPRASREGGAPATLPSGGAAAAGLHRTSPLAPAGKMSIGPVSHSPSRSLHSVRSRTVTSSPMGLLPPAPRQRRRTAATRRKAWRAARARVVCGVSGVGGCIC